MREGQAQFRQIPKLTLTISSYTSNFDVKACFEAVHHFIIGTFILFSASFDCRISGMFTLA